MIFFHTRPIFLLAHGARRNATSCSDVTRKTPWFHRARRNKKIERKHYQTRAPRDEPGLFAGAAPALWRWPLRTAVCVCLASSRAGCAKTTRPWQEAQQGRVNGGVVAGDGGAGGPGRTSRQSASQRASVCACAGGSSDVRRSSSCCTRGETRERTRERTRGRRMGRASPGGMALTSAKEDATTRRRRSAGRQRGGPLNNYERLSNNTSAARRPARASRLRPERSRPAADGEPRRAAIARVGSRTAHAVRDDDRPSCLLTRRVDRSCGSIVRWEEHQV